LLINLGVLFSISKPRNIFINNFIGVDVDSITLFPAEVAIKWKDGTDTVLTYYKLRSLCPCAFCSGEGDVLGNIYKGPIIKIDKKICVIKYVVIGHYGLQFFWSDGHKDGIYTFSFLKNLGG